MAIKGLRGFRYCLLSKDDETGVEYATDITKMVGARNISMSPQLAEGQLYGDDQLLESESTLAAIEVEIELAELPLKQRAELTGQTFENGVLKENKDGVSPEIAFGFMAPKSQTGGGGFRMVWLLKGKMKPMEDGAQTKEDGIEYQPSTATFEFMPRVYDGQYRYIADSNEEGAPTEEQFFTTEFLKDGVVPTGEVGA